MSKGCDLMRWFPIQEETLYTAEPLEQARDAILLSRVKLISCIYHAQETESGSISMTPEFDRALFADSFVPIVTADIVQAQNGSRIILHGELFRSVKFLMALFRIVLAVFTAAVIVITGSGTERAAMLGLMLILVLFNEGMPLLFSYLRFQSFLREFQSECIK